MTHAVRLALLMLLSMALIPAYGSSAMAAGARHADPELEQLRPTTLGGVALTVESQAGTELTTQSGPFDAFLTSLGKSRGDFSLASAYVPGGLRPKSALGASGAPIPP